MTDGNITGMTNTPLGQNIEVTSVGHGLRMVFMFLFQVRPDIKPRFKSKSSGR